MSLLSQDDVVMGTLSVRENLHFSAALRLPSHMTFKQRKERVQRVIEELGLERCASTKVNVYRFKLHASTKHPSIMTHALFPIAGWYRVPSWGVRWREEAYQHWYGVDH